MKKYLTILLILVLTLFNTITVSAEEKNIVVETSRDNNYIYVTYSVKDEAIKGMSTELEYDDSTATFEYCETETTFDLSMHRNNKNLVIVAESLSGKKNKKIMTCAFKIKNSKSSIKLKSIDESTSNNVLKENHEEAEIKLSQIVHVGNTAKNSNNTINYTFAIIFLIAGIFLIYKTIKMKNPVYLLLLLLLPINVGAEEIIHTEENLNKVRDIILKKIVYNQETDAKLDYDQDNKITINDLILIKHNANLPRVTITTTTEGTAQYHTKVTSEFSVDSLTNISEIKYCFGTNDCTPDQKLDKTDKKFTIKHKDHKSPQKLCVKIKNKSGLTTTKCTPNKYLVDGITPTLKFKNDKVSITNNLTHDPLAQVEGTLSGPGLYNAIGCSEPPKTIGTHTITCVITGNNGLSSEHSYTLEITKKHYKILFVGNSKTYQNDIPGKLKGLIEASNYDATITSVTEGGKTLEYLAENYKTELEAINGYEFVIMQEATDRYAENYEGFLKGAQAILKTIKPKNPLIRPVIRQTWVLAEEIDGKFYFKNDEAVTNAYKNAHDVAIKVNGLVIPDGQAFKRATETYRDILLFYDDRHQTAEGAYLSAATIYKHIVNKSPVGNTYIGGLEQDIATKLQQIANTTT